LRFYREFGLLFQITANLGFIAVFFKDLHVACLWACLLRVACVELILCMFIALRIACFFKVMKLCLLQSIVKRLLALVFVSIL